MSNVETLELRTNIKRGVRTPLSKKEQPVCDLIVLGLCNKEIGATLGLSRRTVEDHRASIFKKYRVRNAVELVRAVYDIRDGRK